MEHLSSDPVQTRAGDVELYAGETTLNPAGVPDVDPTFLQQLYAPEPFLIPAAALPAAMPGSNATATPEAHHQVTDALYLEGLARFPIPFLFL